MSIQTFQFVSKGNWCLLANRRRVFGRGRVDRKMCLEESAQSATSDKPDTEIVDADVQGNYVLVPNQSKFRFAGSVLPSAPEWLLVRSSLFLSPNDIRMWVRSQVYYCR